MKKTTLVTLVLFAILLFAAVLINDRPVQRGAERLSFDGLDPETVDVLRIAGPDNANLEITRDQDVWRLADGHIADPDMVQRALEGLQAVDTSEVMSAAQERQTKYGVDVDSGTTVEVTAGGKKVARLVIGNAEGGGTSVRKVGEDLIFQSSSSLNHLFPLEHDRWLKLKLFDATIGEARRIELEFADGAAYAIEPAAEGDDWVLTDSSLVPEGFRFDGAGARSLASAAVSVRASGIVADMSDDEAAGLAGSHDRITVVTRDGRSTLHLGANTDEGNQVFAKIDGREAVFFLPQFQATNLRKRPLDLRDLGLMAFASDEATTLSISGSQLSPRFVKNDAGVWEVDASGPQPPEGFPFDPASVTRLIQSISKLRAIAPADNVTTRQAGLDSPSVHIVVGLEDGRTAELLFGKKTAGEDDATLYYARGNADDSVYLVAEYHHDRFGNGWESFRVVEPPSQMGGNNPFANLDPETLKNLPPEVREGILKQMREQQQQQQLMEQIRRQQGGSS